MKIAFTLEELLSFATQYVPNTGKIIDIDCDEHTGVDLFVVENANQEESTLEFSSVYKALTNILHLSAPVTKHDISEVEFEGVMDEHYIFSA